jgi:hypothetical protein
MSPESGVPEDGCDQDHRLQAISGARFSLPQTQTAQTADSVTVALPVEVHNAYRIELKGESMRKNRIDLTNTVTSNS